MRSYLNSYLDKIYETNSNEDTNKLASSSIDLQKKIEISDETIEIALGHLKNDSQIIDIIINMLLIKDDHKNLIIFVVI